MYTIILLAITSCGLSGTRHGVLDEAQSLLQNDPEAALSRLNSVDIAEFEDSSTMARWALLYSEALVVNRLSAPTDTIVNIAVDYYGRHNIAAEYEKASRLKAQMEEVSGGNELATALYLQKEKEYYLFRERAKRAQMMWGGSIALLLALGAILWMRQRLKLQGMRNSALIAEAASLRCSVSASRGDIERLECKIHGLLDRRFALIDSLCQTYYETQGTKAERKAIIDKVKSEIETVRAGSLSEMEQAVNDCRDNLLVKTKEACPGIKAEDYRLLVYLASGLSSRTISLLLGESIEVIYKRKSRLKSRMKEVAAPMCPEIMGVF